jgi:hypothetical protein
MPASAVRDSDPLPPPVDRCQSRAQPVSPSRSVVPGDRGYAHRRALGPTSAAEVLVTTGAQQALELLVHAEVAPGQAVVTEDPTFPGFLDAVQRAGGRLVGLPPGDGLQPAPPLAALAPRLPNVVTVGSFSKSYARLDVDAAGRRAVDLGASPSCRRWRPSNQAVRVRQNCFATVSP